MTDKPRSRIHEVHATLGSIQGAEITAAWADDDHTAHLDVCVELHESQRLAYVAALTETGTTVRVDLDATGAVARCRRDRGTLWHHGVS